MSSSDDISERQNYATPGNLLSRIALHSFTTNPHWSEWLWERESPRHSDLARPARILDVGCGPGGLWVDRVDIDPAWSITLADTSEGMLDTAYQELGDRYTYVLADIEKLPFEDAAFDVVLANHMLYHVPDRPAAFAEVTRVLRPGGAFHASCNGRGHLRELFALASWKVLGARADEEFGLETGPPQLEAAGFTDVHVDRFETLLAVPEPEPVLAYLRSTVGYSGQDLSTARATVAAAIRRDGDFNITSRPGLVSCRRP